MELQNTSHIFWTGNLGTGTSEPKKKLSIDPLLGGVASKMNPEDLLISSLSACHILGYLHLGADAGFTVPEYKDLPIASGEILKSCAGRIFSAEL